MRRCDYYLHYLAYREADQPDMPHDTYHYVAEEAIKHFATCDYKPPREWFNDHGKLHQCPRCQSFEQRLRA